MPILYPGDIMTAVMCECEDTGIDFFNHKDMPAGKQVKKIILGIELMIGSWLITTVSMHSHSPYLWWSSIAIIWIVIGKQTHVVKLLLQCKGRICSGISPSIYKNETHYSWVLPLTSCLIKSNTSWRPTWMSGSQRNVVLLN